MIWYVMLVAIANLGLGYGLAVLLSGKARVASAAGVSFEGDEEAVEWES